MKVTIEGFAHFRPARFRDDPCFSWYSWGTPVGDSIVVCPQSITLNIPDDFSPENAQLQALRAELDKAGREFAATQRRINAEIQKLTAIGSAVEVAE
jgi:hypothetical protein